MLAEHSFDVEMQKYKLHKDNKVNSIIKMMALRGLLEGDIRDEHLSQNNSILKAKIMERDDFVHSLTRRYD